jgi:hypothetical protein
VISHWVDGFECMLERMVLPLVDMVATEMLELEVLSLDGLMALMTC